MKKLKDFFIAYTVGAPRLRRAGFTMVELLVVIGITVVIATMSLSAYPNFARTTDFQNVLLDVALTLREAQVFGLGTREADAGGVDAFDVAYGVRFSVNDATLIFFIDRNDDGIYNGSLSGESFREFVLRPSFTINRLCVEPACFTPVDTLDITFKRPNPNARVTIDGGGTFILFPEARIEMRSPQGDLKSILVLPTGQISLE